MLSRPVVASVFAVEIGSERSPVARVPVKNDECVLSRVAVATVFFTVALESEMADVIVDRRFLPGGIMKPGHGKSPSESLAVAVRASSSDPVGTQSGPSGMLMPSISACAELAYSSASV